MGCFRSQHPTSNPPPLAPHSFLKSQLSTTPASFSTHGHLGTHPRIQTPQRGRCALHFSIRPPFRFNLAFLTTSTLLSASNSCLFGLSLPLLHSTLLVFLFLIFSLRRPLACDDSFCTVAKAIIPPSSSVNVFPILVTRLPHPPSDTYRLAQCLVLT